MTQKRASVTFISPDCTIVFPSLAEPRLRKDPKTGKPYPNAVPKYECLLAFQLGDFDQVIAPKMLEVLAEDFGEEDAELTLEAFRRGKRSPLRVPFQLGDDFNARRVAAGNEPFSDVAGTVLVSATSNSQPGAVDVSGKEINPGTINGGSIVCAELVFKTMDGALYTGGISYMNNVQLIKVAGRRSATEVFKPRSAGTTGINPFKKAAARPAAPVDQDDKTYF